MTPEVTPLHRRPSAATIGFELWLFVFVAFVGTTLLWTQPVLRLAALAIFALPVLAWAVLRVRGRLELLDVAILAGIGAHLVVSFFSLDRESSLEASAIVLVYAGVFWLARDVGQRPALRRVAAIAIVMALLFWSAVIAVTWVLEKAVDVATFGWPPRLDAYQAYAWGSINTPPALLLLAVPFVAWLPRGGLRRVMAWLLVVCALVIVPFSVGRAAWLGIIVAILSHEVLTGFPLTGRAWRRTSGTWKALTVGMGSVLGVALVALTVGRAGALTVALDSRVLLWKQAAGLFAADPVTGAGPMTFAWARLAHVPDFVDRVAAAAAHNVPVQTLADGGLLLSAAFAFILVAWASQVVRHRRELDRGRRIALAAIIGFAAFSLFDDLSFLPAVTVLAITIAAWVLPPGAPGVAAPRDGARALVVPAVLAIGAVLTLPTALSLGMMRIGLEETRVAAVTGDWEAARAGFRSAAEAQPANALHWLGIGLAEHRLGRDDAAAAAYLTAASVSPGDPRPWGARAALSDGVERIELLYEAARRSNVPQYAFRLGSALLAAGEDSEATKFFAIASVIQPGVYAVVPEVVRADVRAALDEAVDIVGPIGGRDPREATWNAALEADAVDPAAPVQWLVARHADAREEREAAHALAVAIGAEPHAPRTWEAASAVARVGCDREAFDKAELLLDIVGRQSGLGDHAVLIRRPGLYREPDLGDYQPPEQSALPDVPQWPLGLIEVPDCGW